METFCFTVEIKIIYFGLCRSLISENDSKRFERWLKWPLVKVMIVLHDWANRKVQKLQQSVLIQSNFRRFNTFDGHRVTSDQESQQTSKNI